MIEWAFAVCIYHAGVIQPFILRPLGYGVVAPTREVCEAGRQAVLEWSEATREVYVLGRCEKITERLEHIACPSPTN